MLALEIHVAWHSEKTLTRKQKHGFIYWPAYVSSPHVARVELYEKLC